MSKDDDRIAHLAGDSVSSLSDSERADLDGLRDLLGSPATWAEPDPRLEDRIVVAIAAETGAERRRVLGGEPSAARAVAGEPGAARAVAEEPSAARATTRRRRPFRIAWRLPRPTLALGGLATAAAAVIAAVVIAGGGGGGRPALQFAMVVSGTPLAPSAHGTATLTKTGSGWRVQLSATGLPHLFGTTNYYQAWLRNPAGVLVPIGTFNDARKVTLWSGVPVTVYRTLTVTVQPAGDPTSSGRRVLVGTIVSRH